MKGNLVMIDNVWMVAYLNEVGYHLMMLHPEDAKYIAQERYIDDVDFKIVVENNLRKYAKLLNAITKKQSY
jgi:hypothetical protein